MFKHRLYMIIMIAILPALFFIGGPERDASRSIKHAWNLGHIIYFALLPFVYFTFRKKQNRNLKRLICLPIGLALIAGTLIELLQFGFGRTFDIMDLIRNLIGAGVAISFLLPVSHTISKPFKIVVALLVLSQFVPICRSLFDEQMARRNFPILSDFQSPLQLARWEGEAKKRIQEFGQRPNNQTLRVELSTEHFSGVSMRYFKGDWKSYSRFQFRIYNPDVEAIDITCRIHDEHHVQGAQNYDDRFSRRFSIARGWNTVTIDLKDVRHAPKDRQMDLQQIHGIGFFATELPYPRTIFIDDVKLI